MAYEFDFLPVGDAKSGDAIAFRFGELNGSGANQRVVVVDGGFKESGNNLVKHIRTYYGTNVVDLVVSTHPDADHASGLEIVLDEMDVRQLWMHKPWEHADDIARMFHDGRVTDNSVSQALRRSLDDARTLEGIAKRKGIPIVEPFTGLQDASGSLTVVGPTEQYYESLLPSFRGTPEPKEPSPLQKALRAAAELAAKIAELWNWETLTDEGETSAENNSSAILLFRWDGQGVLLTGDAGIPALTWVADMLDGANFDYSTIRLVQVPHHGSQRNVGPSILDRLIGPKLAAEERRRLAYASVSKNGAPKHPAKKATNAFLRRGAPVYVTKGRAITFNKDAPARQGWGPIQPLPFYHEVEE